MKKIFLVLFFPLSLQAQTYMQQIETFRNKYVAEHLLEERSPIKYEDVSNLQFFPIDEKYKTVATVSILQDYKVMTMLTHTGQKKEYYRYAQLKFTLNQKEHVLVLYQSKALIQKKEYRDHLFLPFTDDSNYEQSFGGGRYIDFVLSDIKDGMLLLDFNKAYNPYCAYAGGFNCPIPPKENDLKINIEAGEKLPKMEVSTH